MKKEYQSSLTGEVKFATGFFVFYWLFTTLISIENNGIRSSLGVSIFVLIFAILFVYALIKFTYLIIDDGKIKYVHMFLQRNELDINIITKIQMGTVGGVFKFLFLTYEINGKTKHLKISPITFKKETIQSFILYLKNLNQKMDIDKSAEDLFLS
ncbi:MAG: hypothetical protein AAB873_00645 [Patescibacteria group bacterium]